MAVTEVMKPNLVAAFARKWGTDVRPATEHERTILAAAGIPESLCSIVARQWFEAYSGFDGVEIFDLASVCEEVRGTFTKHLPAGGFLPVGKAGNGDLLVVDFSHADFPVGYIRVASWPVREPPPRNTFVVVSDSLQAFLERGSRRATITEFFLRRPRFPRDSYDAEKQRNSESSVSQQPS